VQKLSKYSAIVRRFSSTKNEPEFLIDTRTYVDGETYVRGSNDLELTFLGTGSQKPSRTRHCQAIHLEHNSRAYLFDCAEATQHRIIQTGVSTHISHIFISHLHGDHVLGLPGMLLHLYHCSPPGGGKRDIIKVFGPPGLRSWLRHTLNLCSATAENMIVHELHSLESSQDEKPHAHNIFPNEDNVWTL
jgi:ribonuclease BN (tRNA processing enzyme)